MVHPHALVCTTSRRANRAIRAGREPCGVTTDRATREPGHERTLLVRRGTTGHVHISRVLPVRQPCALLRRKHGPRYRRAPHAHDTGRGRRTAGSSQLSSGTHSTHWHASSCKASRHVGPLYTPPSALCRAGPRPTSWVYTHAHTLPLVYQSPSAIGALGERMTQCGLGWCFAQNASGSLGACFSCSSLGAHDSKDGSDTHWGCAEQ